MPGKRPQAALVEKRILDVFKLLLRGADRAEIWRHLAENGAEPERTADRYIARATARFKALAKVDAEKERGRQLARLEDLYSRLFRIQDYRTALAVLKERNELAGIYPEKVQKHEHTGRDGAPMSLLVGRLEPDVEEIRRRLLAEAEAAEGRGDADPAPPETD
ncbi:MAG: hypothetical protein KBB14_05480 [Thermoanaerobaculia bacterium]|nr:hypothetical protein [Thermoanaerobaculia bacterium]